MGSVSVYSWWVVARDPTLLPLSEHWLATVILLEASKRSQSLLTTLRPRVVRHDIALVYFEL